MQNPVLAGLRSEAGRAAPVANEQPQAAGLVWSKPKASTFARFGGCMVLDEAGHVQWAGLTEYTGGKEASAWFAEYGAGVPAALLKTARGWVAAKVAFNDARAAGATEVTVGSGTGAGQNWPALLGNIR